MDFMRCMLLTLALIVSCSNLREAWDSWDCWSIDGKAASWCESEKDFKRACKKHGGLKKVGTPFSATCNDGTELKR